MLKREISSCSSEELLFGDAIVVLSLEFVVLDNEDEELPVVVEEDDDVDDEELELSEFLAWWKGSISLWEANSLISSHI